VLARPDLERAVHGTKCTEVYLSPGGRIKMGPTMATPKELRSQAKECLELAEASSDVYVRDALTDLARHYNRDARQAERRERAIAIWSGVHVHSQ
jgi:hypothetical protein